jgi:predicted RNase H-like nuclease (RuvC/YqgF family)
MSTTVELTPLPNEMLPIVSSSSDSDSDSESSDEDEQDDLVKALEENAILKERLKNLQTELSELKRQFAVANNIRIAQKDKMVKLEAEVKVHLKEIDKLTKRNSCLQDLLLDKTSGKISLP